MMELTSGRRTGIRLFYNEGADLRTNLQLNPLFYVATGGA
jgi:hypothetical protein